MTVTAAGYPTVTPVPFDPEVQIVLDAIAQNPQPALTRDTLPAKARTRCSPTTTR
jgi:hypothetical protein